MIDALVVGAGPSGLFTAIELKRRGLSVRIIEANLTRSPYSKAIAIQPRSLEIFDQMGIIDPFLSQGLKIHGAHLRDSSRTLAHLSFKDLDSPYPFILSLEQSHTEQILEEHLATLGVQVERGVSLLSFEQETSCVSAVLSTGSVNASWLLGCDGAHSTTRKALGISFEGSTFPQKFSLADVQIEWDFPHDEVSLFLNREGILALLPLPGRKRYRVIFQAEPTFSSLQNQLHRFAHPHCKTSQPEWLSEFTINSRIAKRYGIGRIFLIGDAAHIHSPAGGQGMNTGFQDAYNLIWKLALIHHKKAKPSLLKTYEKERRSIGKHLVEGTKEISKMATLKNPFLIALRNFLLRKLLNYNPIRNIFLRTLTQTATRAPDAPINDTTLYHLARTKRGFFVLYTQNPNLEELKATFPDVTFLLHDGTIYDPSLFYLIRPDWLIGTKSPHLSTISTYLYSHHL